MESINNSGGAANDHQVKIRIAKITTNLAGVLGLTETGIGIKTVVGWDQAADKSYVNTVTRHMKNVGSAWTGVGLLMGVELNLMKMANVLFYVNPSLTNKFIAGFNTSQKIAGFPLNFEIVMDGKGADELGDANVIIDGEFKPTFGDIKVDAGFGVELDLKSDANADPAMGWLYGFGVGVTAAKVVNVRFNLNGNAVAEGADSQALDWITLEANLGKFADLITFRVAGYLWLSQDDPFQGLDFCANLAFGKLDLRTGYVMNAETGSKTCHTWAHSSVAGVGNLYMRGRIAF
jgi:hypothetical protein